MQLNLSAIQTEEVNRFFRLLDEQFPNLQSQEEGSRLLAYEFLEKATGCLRRLCQEHPSRKLAYEYLLWNLLALEQAQGLSEERYWVLDENEVNFLVQSDLMLNLDAFVKGQMLKEGVTVSPRLIEQSRLYLDVKRTFKPGKSDFAVS